MTGGEACLGLLLPPLADCVPLVDVEVFRAGMTAAHPPGSSVEALRQAPLAPAFSAGRPFGPPVDLDGCLTRWVGYWLVAGGDRYVYYDAEDGVLIGVVAEEFVMSP